jgi:hypothetical protein
MQVADVDRRRQTHRGGVRERSRSSEIRIHGDGADPSLPIFAELLSGEAELLRLLFFAVDGAEEGATLDLECFSGALGRCSKARRASPSTVGGAPGSIRSKRILGGELV